MRRVCERDQIPDNAGGAVGVLANFSQLFGVLFAAIGEQHELGVAEHALKRPLQLLRQVAHHRADAGELVVSGCGVPCGGDLRPQARDLAAMSELTHDQRRHGGGGNNERQEVCHRRRTS